MHPLVHRTLRRTAALWLACAAPFAFAQAPQPGAQPSPEQMRQVMQATMSATMGAMIEAMGPMTQAVIDAQLAAAARPETAERIAAFKKNLYDALVKQGFQPAQALQIVVATAPPSATPSGK